MANITTRKSEYDANEDATEVKKKLPKRKGGRPKTSATS